MTWAMVSSFWIRASLRTISAYRRAFSMATATWLASGVSTFTCSSVKRSRAGDSRSNTPTTRSLWMSGTTSSERVSGMRAR